MATKEKTDKRRTDERVHSAIFAAIINHQLRPATQLQEDALAAAFGVSRTIIRKVLQQLAHEKLVVITPNKGARVARPTTEEARQVFEARHTIERELVSTVARRAQGKELDGLRGIVEEERRAQEADDKRRRVQLSGDFHRALAGLAGNDVLATFLSELVSRTSLIIALYEKPGAVPCSCEEHQEIIDALARRDEAAAIDRMSHHLKHIESQVDLSQSTGGVDFRSLFAAVE
ncbi:GntR family transcriptional regulator [Neotabrizicola sp. VNH66]|uniref:GntR family transcriptional regulator n=1 Tax=Neotabrizicola sp. VNH66 TaxID=3400918 RepID=UPI003C0BC72A